MRGASANLTAVLRRWQDLEPATFPVDERIDLYAFYAFDAVLAIAHAARLAVASGWRPLVRRPGAPCFRPFGNVTSEDQPGGLALERAMRQIAVSGLTGLLQWRDSGSDRVDSTISVLNVQRRPGPTPTGLREAVDVANWSPLPAEAQLRVLGTFSPSPPTVFWPGGRLQAPSDRDSLRGKRLRAVTIIAPPFVSWGRAVGAAPRLEGVIVDLVAAMGDELGFTVEWTVTNLSYAAAINAVGAGTFDAMFSDVTINSARQRIVSLTVPFYSDGMRVAARQETEPAVDIFSFLYPFSTPLWALIVGMVTVTGALFVLMERGRNEAIRSPDAGGLPLPQLLFMGWWYMAMAFIGGDTSFSPTTKHGRVLLMGVSFSSLILLATYTGSVASALTARNVPKGVSGFDDLMRQRVPASRVGAVAGSNTAGVFTRTAGFTPLLFPTVDAMLQVSMPAIAQAARLAAHERGPCRRSQSVASTPASTLAASSSMPSPLASATSMCERIAAPSRCLLVTPTSRSQVVGNQFGQSDFGFALTKSLEHYAEPMNDAILRARESGELARLYSSHMRSTCPGPSNAGANEPDSFVMGAQEMGGVFITMGAVVCISAIMWACADLSCCRHLWMCGRCTACSQAQAEPLSWTGGLAVPDEKSAGISVVELRKA